MKLKRIDSNVGITIDDLISQSNIDRVENNPFYIDEELTNWNWTDFFKNMSMVGVHRSKAFKDEINADPVKKATYLYYVNSAGQFSKDCNE